MPWQVGFPERAVVPGLGDSLRLLGVGLASFGAQVLLNRAFRLEAAFKMATMSLTQVCTPLSALPSMMPSHSQRIPVQAQLGKYAGMYRY